MFKAILCMRIINLRTFGRGLLIFFLEENKRNMGAETSKNDDIDEFTAIISHDDVPEQFKERLKQLYETCKERFSVTSSNYDRLKVDSGTFALELRIVYSLDH